MIKIKLSPAEVNYPIIVRAGLLEESGNWAARSIGKGAKRVAIVSNHTIWELYGDNLSSSLKSAGLEFKEILLPDGEKYKSLQTLQKILLQLSENKLSREDLIIGFGGGVIGDITGFAASIYLRGCNFLQIPTTLLAMIDASVGGKTGVNTDFGKNLVGTFYNPRAVLIDPLLLQTLDKRQIIAAYCEAAKHALLAGGRLFDETKAFLRSFPADSLQGIPRSVKTQQRVSKLIQQQINFKASIIREDPFEQAGRSDPRSRKILNFGHTFGHALEQVTNYRKLLHGEAVGYGMLFESILAKKLELLEDPELELLYDVVRSCGTLPPLGTINIAEIKKAISFDKKKLSGSVQWVLLKKIGRPVVISQSQIPQKVLDSALEEFLK
ncbi:MAG TPA: 3-dehydroquinate synthase [Pyrinomonadaceae bacterium]|nr:3-dehydroquinate synthase [Pyrinomonadaceae bacterium]